MPVTYYSIRLLLIVALFHDYKWISSSAYRFALVPKIQDNPFFDVSREGCQDKANELGHECVYVGPREEDPDGTLQLEILKKLIRNTTHKIDGIAVSVRSADNQELTAVIQEAVQERGIPFVTFDSDAAPNTLRSAYIGTDNFFFGTQLAKVLEQIHPTGNKYYAIASQSDPNIREREEGLRAQLAEFGWTEVPTSPSDMMGNVSLAMDQMREFAAEYPQLAAIVPVRGGPMRSGQWKQFVMEHRHLRLVVADALPNQLEFLSRDYCHGLVGKFIFILDCALSCDAANRPRYMIT